MSSSAELSPLTPLPPPELRDRVAGTDDASWFDRSGQYTLRDFEGALGTLNKRMADFASIYDFGCGVGRVTRWLAAAAAHATIWGSDIDKEAIEWLRVNQPEVNAFRNDWLPPLPFRDGLFDLVLGWSVFTHLPEHYQDAWLEELRRVTAPGGILLLSTHGLNHWQAMKSTDLAAWTDSTVSDVDDALDSYGFAYLDIGAHTPLPDFYRFAWHAPSYIHDRWSHWFTVIDLLEDAGMPETGRPHDIVVLSRSGS
jgi:SAM-dependent methyltransferase